MQLSNFQLFSLFFVILGDLFILANNIAIFFAFYSGPEIFSFGVPKG